MSGWIPVTKMLPEIDELVLLWCISPEYSRCQRDQYQIGFLSGGNIENQNSLLFYNRDFFSVYEVDAWQPLPTPYKG